MVGGGGEEGGLGLFGQLGDDPDESAVLVSQPLVVALQLIQGLEYGNKYYSLCAKMATMSQERATEKDFNAYLYHYYRCCNKLNFKIISQEDMAMSMCNGTDGHTCG